MSETQNAQQPPIDDESIVVDYLRQHPDFFAYHTELLTQLRIPHQSGDAISLVERQISLYREKNQRLEKQLKELLDVAHQNERLSQLLHAFASRLMRTQTVDAVLDITYKTVRRDFHADEISLHLFDEDTAIADVFAEMSATRNVVCATLSGEKHALLFENAGKIASVALILLHAEGDNLGVLALASADEAHFHPSKGVLFLSQLGNLLSHRLATL